MSNQKDINDLVRQLEAKGWRVTQGGKHRKLIAPSGKKITAPGSVSDHRGFMNFRADIRRAMALENSLQAPPLFKMQQAPAAVPIMEPEPVQKEEPIMKRLTSDLLPKVQALLADGLNQRQIGELLTKDGYRTGGGSNIEQTHISVFLRKHGVRMREQGKPRSPNKPKMQHQAPPPIVEVAPPKAPASKLLHEVEDIISSNLSPDLKERFLKSILKG